MKLYSSLPLQWTLIAVSFVVASNNVPVSLAHEQHKTNFRAQPKQARDDVNDHQSLHQRSLKADEDFTVHVKDTSYHIAPPMQRGQPDPTSGRDGESDTRQINGQGDMNGHSRNAPTDPHLHTISAKHSGAGNYQDANPRQQYQPKQHNQHPQDRVYLPKENKNADQPPQDRVYLPKQDKNSKQSGGKSDLSEFDRTNHATNDITDPTGDGDVSAFPKEPVAKRTIGSASRANDVRVNDVDAKYYDIPDAESRTRMMVVGASVMLFLLILCCQLCCH